MARPPAQIEAIAALPDGTTFVWFGENAICSHPEHKPVVIEPDGSPVVLEICASDVPLVVHQERLYGVSDVDRQTILWWDPPDAAKW